MPSPETTPLWRGPALIVGGILVVTLSAPCFVGALTGHPTLAIPGGLLFIAGAAMVMKAWNER